MSRKEYLKRKFREHLIGPAGSVVLHLVILYLAVTFIVFEVSDEAPDVEVRVVDMETMDLDDLDDIEPPELEDLEFEDLDFDMPDIEVDMEVPPEEEFAQDPQVDMDLDAFDIRPIESPLQMRGLFADRTDAGRAAGRGRGGSAAAEQAVLRALEWLRLNQNDNGSWTKEMGATPGTALGLLTFLAHGETQSSERYGHTVRRAIRYLLDQQRDDGRFTGEGREVYVHGLATYAMAEAYAMTRIPGLLDSMDRGIQHLIDRQQPAGGWNYGFEQGARRDTSVSAFMVQALKAAELAESEVEGIDEAMEQAVRDLRSVYNSNHGSFGYTETGGRSDRDMLSMTPIAVLAHQLTGYGRSSEARAGVQLVYEVARMDWDDPMAWAMYRSYYITQAMFQAGGSVWTGWNNQFAPAFIRNQNEDGSWTSPGNERNHGPVYATTFAALSLQVYYRVLPTFGMVEEREEKEEDDDDEVVVEIFEII